MDRRNRRNHRRPEENENRSEDERYQHPLVRGQPARCWEFVTADACRSQPTWLDRDQHACGRKTCRKRSRGHLLRPPLPANRGLKTTITNSSEAGSWIRSTDPCSPPTHNYPRNDRLLGPSEIPRGDGSLLRPARPSRSPRVFWPSGRTFVGHRCGRRQHDAGPRPGRAARDRDPDPGCRHEHDHRPRRQLSPGRHRHGNGSVAAPQGRGRRRHPRARARRAVPGRGDLAEPDRRPAEGRAPRQPVGGTDAVPRLADLCAGRRGSCRGRLRRSHWHLLRLLSRAQGGPVWIQSDPCASSRCGQSNRLPLRGVYLHNASSAPADGDRLRGGVTQARESCWIRWIPLSDSRQP